MDNFNINDCKTTLQNMTNKLVEHYFSIEKQLLQEKQYNSESLSTMNSNNVSLCEEIISKDKLIYSLEKEVEGYKSRENELNDIISNLKDNKQKDDERNKFDIVRSQAKEITAKDNEIMRLTKELTKMKELNNIKSNIDVKVKENSTVTSKNISGWSLTTSTLPSPEVKPLNISKDITKDTSDSVSNETIGNDETNSTNDTNDNDRRRIVYNQIW